MGCGAMPYAHFLALYRDVVTLAVAGLACALVAGWSIWAEIRRYRRKRMDAVGFMPWTAIHLVALLGACVFLGLAAHDWFTG